MDHDYDWVVIGSGFGGSVAALRLVEKGYRVAVLEQGRRFADEDFARSAWEVGKLIWAPSLGLRGILRVALFRHVSVLGGVGVGGGSLVYANTLYVPDSDAFYGHSQWAGLADWRTELAPHYATAERMLGVVDYEGEGPGERLMRGLADDLGVPGSYHPTRVGVYFGEPGRHAPDPYFDGEGPPRSGCVRCGQCMLGCRHGAKNTLDKNYLWLAERRGASILSERKVTDVTPLDRDGSAGYAVRWRRPGASLRGGTITAGAVVLAGGALGTNELLRLCKARGSLPNLSDRLGELVRTNSEAIVAATTTANGTDYGRSIAITASVHPDERTHFTNNTLGGGGDALALAFGPLANGGGRGARLRRLLEEKARHPLRYVNPLRSRGWSRRTVLFTVMQDTDSALRLRPRWGPLAWLRPLETEQDERHPVRSHLPIADRVATLAALRMGGYPQGSIADALRGTPTTAHFLGGAVIGRDPASGVVDAEQRAFGYRNLLVCDGSVLPANVGVNPSLTITALAERAMARIPDARPRPRSALPVAISGP